MSTSPWQAKWTARQRFAVGQRLLAGPLRWPPRPAAVFVPIVSTSVRVAGQGESVRPR